MPRITQTESGTILLASASDTYEWAHRAGKAWPGSQLSGHRIRAEFDSRGDLVDYSIDGRYGVDIDAHEFTAMTSDLLRAKFGPEHPAIR